MREAWNIAWADCDFVREEIIVLGVPEEGTKNSEVRRVPMIAEMNELLARLRKERRTESPATRVMHIGQCQIATATWTWWFQAAKITAPRGPIILAQ